MEKLNNTAYIEGIVCEVEVFGNEIRGIVEVERTSGVVDKVPFRSTDLDIAKEDWICLKGCLETENVRDQYGKSHKRMFVRGRKEQVSYVYRNEIEFYGTLVRKDSLRETPKGRILMDLILAINSDQGKSQYPAVIVWGLSARMLEGFSIGTNLYVWGRFQSREYTKETEQGQEVRVAYEISVRDLEV